MRRTEYPSLTLLSPTLGLAFVERAVKVSVRSNQSRSQKLLSLIAMRFCVLHLWKCLSAQTGAAKTGISPQACDLNWANSSRMRWLQNSTRFFSWYLSFSMSFRNRLITSSWQLCGNFSVAQLSGFWNIKFPRSSHQVLRNSAWSVARAQSIKAPQVCTGMGSSFLFQLLTAWEASRAAWHSLRLLR